MTAVLIPYLLLYQLLTDTNTPHGTSSSTRVETQIMRASERCNLRSEEIVKKWIGNLAKDYTHNMQLWSQPTL
jgi:hypothetical protein